MNKIIQKQKNLMNRALDCIRGIEQYEFLFTKLDPEYCNKKIEELRVEYAEIMAELMVTVMYQAKDISAPEPETAVQLAEQFAG